MKIIYLFLISSLALCPVANAEKAKQDLSKAEYIEGIYIPRNLEETWGVLEKNLSEQDRQKIKTISEDEYVAKDFFGTMGLRNDWGLWRGSRLANYFNGLGVNHPDDMSLLIHQTFWCHINDRPIRLEERIAYFKEFWINRSDPPHETFPEKDIHELGAQDYATPKGKYFGYIRVFKNKKSGNVWLFEYNKGWKRVDDEFLNKYPHWKNTINKNP